MRDGTRIFGAMLDVIERARETVVLESYIVVDDSVGERFSSRAARGRGARREGARDRGLGREPRRPRARSGARCAKAASRSASSTSPAFTRWLGLLPRDHRKVLVADEEVCVTGGIGLSEVWSGFVKRKKRAPWRDTAVLIRGPAAVDMARAFETMWKRANHEERRAARRHVVRRARNTDTTPERVHGAVVGIIEGEPWRLRVARALQIQSVSAREGDLDRERVLLSVERGDRGPVRCGARRRGRARARAEQVRPSVGAEAHAQRVQAAAAQRRAHLGVERQS